MRVALLGPVAWRTPPHHYGPWEQVTGLLAEGLVTRGVEVTLFATLDSVTSAALDGVCPRGYADDPAMDARARSSYVSISDADRSADLDYVATVHHGVDLTGLPFTRDAGPGLAAFGRIHPDKGTHTAIEIARRAGRPLTICGIVQDERYFAEQVAPHIDGDRVVFLGSVGPRRRADPR